MSRTQLTVSGTLTATRTPQYRTFDSEEEYKSWLVQFNAQNADGQCVIDFRVCHHDHAESASPSILHLAVDLQTRKSLGVPMHLGS
jgi:hypothetical protein